MRAILRDRGHYELVATSRGSRVLVLNGTAWFPWVLATEAAEETGEEPPPLRGEFYLVDVVAAPGSDARRLFLERSGAFEEVLLPQGTPADPSAERVVLRTGRRATREDLEASLSDRAASVF